jgi:predicted nicotinamide N-methyase
LLTPALVHTGGRDWNLLRVKDQDALIAQVQTDEDLENFPFGLMLWASAVALAEAIPPGEGRRLLELGAGVGLAGLVAQAKGWRVTQTDYDSRALALCGQNAARNDVTGIEIRAGDWRDFPEDLTSGFDLVVGADILYERSLHPALQELLPRFGCPILIADPLRPQATAFLTRIETDGWRAALTVQYVSWDEDPRRVAVFRLEREGIPGPSA